MTDGKRNYIKPSSSQLIAVQLVVVVVLVVILPLVVQQQQLKNCHLGIYQRKTTLGHKKKRPAGKLSSHCMKIWRCLPPERLGSKTTTKIIAITTQKPRVPSNLSPSTTLIALQQLWMIVTTFPLGNEDQKIGEEGAFKPFLWDGHNSSSSQHIGMKPWVFSTATTTVFQCEIYQVIWPERLFIYMLTRFARHQFQNAKVAPHPSVNIWQIANHSIWHKEHLFFCFFGGLVYKLSLSKTQFTTHLLYTTTIS